MTTARTRPGLTAGDWTAERFGSDRNAMVWALAAAVAVHLLFLLIQLPERPVVTVRPAPPDEPPTIWKPLLRPPPRPEPEVARDRTTDAPRIPVPFPVAAPPEPVAEAPPEIPADAEAFDAPPLITQPVDPPPTRGPLTPGSGEVTYPVLVPESKVTPDYPELPRRARIESRVIVRAVILADGTVSEIELLHCDRPGLGFEEAAFEAIARWRYEPARQHGVPVDVYFTVVVDFELQ